MKPESINPHALARARSDSLELNALSDEMNKRIEIVETALLGWSVTIAVEWPIDKAGGTRLVWAKHDGVWMLGIVGPSAPFVPLRSASRAIRIAAVDVLPQLIDEIVSRQSNMVHEVRGAIVKLDHLLSTLQKKG